MTLVDRAETPVVAALVEDALIQVEHGPDTLVRVERVIVQDGGLDPVPALTPT